MVDMESITDDEYVHGTMRLLPPMEIIPEEYFDRNWASLDYAKNPYTMLAEAMYYGDPQPLYTWVYDKGYSEDIDALLHRTIMAHVNTFEPGLIHKITGVGFMISQVVTLTE